MKATKSARAVQVVTVTEDRKFELDEIALGDILLRDCIRDVPVVVVSIAGDFRKGKSFMLNHFLRYLQSCSDSSLNHDNPNDAWISDLKAPLTGFAWRGGSERETTGILMWSEPFVIRVPPKNSAVGVLLMDTQGCFDSEYTIKDSATVFALSTMLSSIQLFNVMHNLQEDNLQVLEIFCEYGRLATEDKRMTAYSKPFQRLVFLIRDWSYPYQYPFGFAGGQLLLDSLLQVKDSMPEQLKQVRRRVRDCFQEIDCFLMPHPGSIVATKNTFDGRLADYDPLFVTALKEFVPGILRPTRLTVKHIGGRQVTGRALLQYFKAYLTIFTSNSMPEPKTMLEATAEVNNLTAVAVIQDLYQSLMDDQCGARQPYINPNLLATRHDHIKQHCLEQFDRIPKMGGEHFSALYRTRLDQSLDQSYVSYVAANDRKNMFSLIGTPLILLVVGLAALAAGKTTQVFGLTCVCNCLHTIGAALVVVQFVYVCARYTGHYPHFVARVERVVDQCWRPLCGYVTQHLLHYRAIQLVDH